MKKILFSSHVIFSCFVASVWKLNWIEVLTTTKTTTHSPIESHKQLIAYVKALCSKKNSQDIHNNIKLCHKQQGFVNCSNLCIPKTFPQLCFWVIRNQCPILCYTKNMFPTWLSNNKINDSIFGLFVQKLHPTLLSRRTTSGLNIW